VAEVSPARLRLNGRGENGDAVSSYWIELARDPADGTQDGARS
jgi:hypothetical protein